MRSPGQCRLGGHDLDRCRGPAGQVVGHHLRQGSVGGEAARGEMVQADAVLEVSDGVLDLGVAAMVNLQFQRWVGDEAVIAVGRRGPVGNPPDDPHRRGVGLALEGGVNPVGNWRPVLLGNRLDEIPQALVAGG